MPSRELSISQEFLNHDWVTYGLAELTRGGSLLDSSPETIDKLEQLTFVLYNGNDTAVDRAGQLLNVWLEQNPDAPAAMGLRLRHVLCLKKLQNNDAALQELDLLLKKDSGSASLYCLQGVLHGWNGDVKAAIKSFDKAIQLNPRWLEPKLERIEKTIVDNDPRTVIRLADDYLRAPGLSPRERLILKVNRAVASVLVNVSYFDTEGGKAQQTEIREIEIDDRYREDWLVKPIWNYVRDKPDMEVPPDVKSKLFTLLALVHEKLMPKDKPLER